MAKGEHHWRSGSTFTSHVHGPYAHVRTVTSVTVCKHAHAYTVVDTKARSEHTVGAVGGGD
jgi:hypothetical protein